MKRNICGIGITCFLLTFLFLSCKKKDIIRQSDNPGTTSSPGLVFEGKMFDTLAYYTDIFLRDTTFNKFFETTANTTLDIVSTVKSNCGAAIKPNYEMLTHSYTDYDQIDQFYLSHSIDTAEMIDKKAESLTSLVMLRAYHPGFFKISENLRKTIIRNVLDSLRSPDYRNANTSAECVVKYMAFYNRISHNGAAGRLTMEEVTECLKDALGGAVVGLASLSSTIYNAVASSNFGWATIRTIAKQSLKSFAGGAIVGSLISFGWCILWDTID